MNLFLFLLTFSVIFVSIETQLSSEGNNSLEEENDSTFSGSPITGPPSSPPSPSPSPQSPPLPSPQRRRRIFGPNIPLISLESKEVSNDLNQKFDKRSESRAQIMAKWETEVEDIEIEESISGEKKARIRSFDSKGSLSAGIKSNSDFDFSNKNLIKGQKTKGIIESILKRNKREINETEVNKQQNNNNSEQQNQNKGFFEEAKETIEKGAKKVGEFFDKAGKAIKGVADQVFGNKN